MNLGKRHLLTALLGLALAIPVRAQNPPSGPGPAGPAAAAAGPFNNAPPVLAPPSFCPPGETTRNIVYPFGEGTDSYRPIGNAFYDPREVEGPMTGRADANAVAPPDFYVGLGVMAMRRTTLNREVVAELAPPLSYTAPKDVNLQAVPMPFLYGVRAEVGINFGPGVLELSGFYLFNQNASYSQTGYVNPLIFAPLFNSQANFANYPAPAGFNPALWTATNANFLVTLNYSLAVGNLELNYRMPVLERTVLLFGLRYVDTTEQLDIKTSDAAGTTDYSVRTRSRIVGPQIGFEFEQPLIRNVSVEFTGKAAGGVNVFYVSHSLTQGNGLQGPGSDVNGVQPAGLLELGLFANIWFTEQIKLHVGYELMWIVNAPEAQSQVNFNTNVGTGTQDYHGSYFFQGPAIELLLAF